MMSSCERSPLSCDCSRGTPTCLELTAAARLLSERLSPSTPRSSITFRFSRRAVIFLLELSLNEPPPSSLALSDGQSRRLRSSRRWIS